MKQVVYVMMLAALFALGACGNKGKQVENETAKKPALMWFDAEANFGRFNQKDSIDFYLKKIKDLGFTHAIVDVRPITGEVLFDSQYAPRMEEWKGAPKGDFDYLGYFIEQGHKLGLEIHASLNVFCAGHNYFDRGVVYNGHPEWVSMVYNPEKGIIPITEEKHKYGAMINPVNEEYQAYMLNILKELVAKYPELDGLMLDRVRYDGISADFSPLSRQKFEAYLGAKVENFPEDILQWEKGEGKRYLPKPGKLSKKWFEWRTKTITDFMAVMRKEVKSVNPNISFGTYTGAWYPSYYEVGVNFASKEYDPSQEYDWATSEYKNYGYADLIDLYATGNYYTDITIEEYKKNNNSIWNETDSQAQSGTWYCVEGSCQKLRQIMKDNKFMGGILVDQFYDNPQKLTETIAMNLKESDGLMVFDIVHIISKNLWKEVEEGMKQGGAL
ncbi:MAG: family 10 glycosylhydrolase [Bacteroides sp.]|nr:family 10 glycosylhydrolase [Bacteroides sp.]